MPWMAVSLGISRSRDSLNLSFMEICNYQASGLQRKERRRDKIKRHSKIKGLFARCVSQGILVKKLNSEIVRGVRGGAGTSEDSWPHMKWGDEQLVSNDLFFLPL